MQKLREVYEKIQNKLDKKVSNETSILVNDANANFQEVRGRIQGLNMAQKEVKTIFGEIAKDYE